MRVRSNGMMLARPAASDAVLRARPDTLAVQWSRPTVPPRRGVAEGAIAIIVPALNEAENIAGTVAGVKSAMPEATVIVISDGSTDATSVMARRAGAIVLELPFNLGIGGAVQTGYKFASARGFRIVARLDGDGQHDPAELARLLEPVLAGRADIAIGSRFAAAHECSDDDTYQATAPRAIGIRLFARLASLLVGQRLTDTTSGFQACNAAAAAAFARRLPCDYPEIEMIVGACRSGFRVQEVPVRMRRRRSGRSSITALRSLYYVAKMLLVLVMTLVRRPDPRLDTVPDNDEAGSVRARAGRGFASS